MNTLKAFEAELEIVNFEINDIITTSPNAGNDDESVTM